MAVDNRFREAVADEITLTLGDRINYPFLLAQQIMTYQKSVVKEETKQSTQEIIEAAEGLYEMIPDAWRITDKGGFADEVKNARITVFMDQRAYWCGYRVGPKTVENQIPYVTTNPHKLFHACINLLQRRGLLARVLYTEVKTGVEYEKEESEEEAKAKDTGQGTKIQEEEKKSAEAKT